MLNREYDAVVIGAGPAGSIAARVLSEGGARVLVVEKRQEIGTPKRCAEGINAAGLRRVGLNPDPLWAVRKIRGAALYSPSGRSLKVFLDSREGYVIERKIFEKHLARDAIRKGARYMVKTLATGVVKEGGRISGVRLRHMGDEFDISSKLVIAADGVDSMMAKSAGLKTGNILSDYHSGFQYEMAGLNLEDSDILHIYFGDDIAPKGYVWIFPKDDDVANVGVGILGALSRTGGKARDYLDAFIENHPGIFKDASPIEINAGGIPVSSATEQLVSDGFMIVGDAAHQVNPIHGGGIALAMNAARIAGEVGAAALTEGDLSRERLYEYERIWRDTDGVKMRRLLKLRSFMEKLESSDFEILASTLTSDDVMRLTEGEYSSLVRKFIKKAPKLIPVAKKFLSGSEDA
ncbi:MAG: NAD(P)/FAD-dependent oxidoreductase [Candidatus Altiarchaeota archaeon]|nr:NAD(P)/FAD-dependent oxidoreductase [Candidatus Altiarchaeota archaeon]